MNKNHIITIGRQLGSGGSAIGKRIADRFGFQYIDKEVLVKACENVWFSPESLKMADEKITSAWTLISQMAIPEFPYYNSDAWLIPTSRQLFELQTMIMQKAVEKGPCVIIGRCSPYLFRDYENHTSIFLQADVESRIARLKKNLGKDFDKHTLDREDKGRAKYFHAFTGEKWLDPAMYDLMLDTSPFSDEEIVDIVTNYILCRFPELK